MNFMYCIACGCITGYIVELPATLSTCHMIYHNINMLVHMGTVISVNKVYTVYGLHMDVWQILWHIIVLWVL